MERVQDNKQSSLMFEQLFKQHYRTLCFHAMSLVNDLDTSKDIAHDVFLSLWYHRATIDFTRPILPYLFSLTRNRALNYLEHKKIQNNHVRSTPCRRPDLHAIGRFHPGRIVGTHSSPHRTPPRTLLASDETLFYRM